MDKNAWNYFNHCYVITTIGSKYAHEVTTDLKKAGIPSQNIDVWAFPKMKRAEKGEFPTLNTNNGGDGYSIWNALITGSNPDPISVDISKSHLKVIQDAFDKGYQNVLVFEDDARFDSPMGNFKEKLNRIIQWLSKNQWDIFYFGCTVYPPLFNRKITNEIDKTMFPMASHAYAISRVGMAKVLADSHKITKEYVPIDTYYRNNFNLDKYMIYPSINNQCKPPALYQKTADLIGLDYIVDYYQCCHLLEDFSHHSWSIMIALAVFFLYLLYRYGLSRL